MPKYLMRKCAKDVQFLDLSYNSFRDLTFLGRFPQLKFLILDRNVSLDHSTFPLLKDLQLLWLNNCNIVNMLEWLKTIREQCPALEHLSMMCNPVGNTVLNGVTESDEQRYRAEVLQFLPQLDCLDGIPICHGARKPSAIELITRLWVSYSGLGGFQRPTRKA